MKGKLINIKDMSSNCDNNYQNKLIDILLDVLSKKDKSLNRAIKFHLLSLGLPFTEEFSLGNYLYDFKLGNYLLEIDPYSTHNSTWGIWDNPKDKMYHRNKTLFAVNNGYTCIHIFDWVDLDYIIWAIMNHELHIIDKGEVNPHYYNVNTHSLDDRESEQTVTIWDDGFEIKVEDLNIYENKKD